MILRCTILALGLVLTGQACAATADNRNEDIEIVEGDERTIYEYSVNGVTTMIKVVPEKGPPYYMVPADGSPHYQSLEHADKLYPRWVIIKF